MNPHLNFNLSKLILAPMVRICGLPMRLVALDYGADVVFCEEIIDFKMLQCKRIENKLLDTIDFVWSDGTVVFRTCAKEREQLIFQIGSSDAHRAVKVAKMVEDCVAGIDVNMGCPKEFSIKGGMGAALMENPDKFTDIFQSLVTSISKPISCKTRIKSTIAETIEMMKKIESTGVSWITLHGRLKEERPRHDNHDDVIAQVSKEMKIPIIANGGSNCIKTLEDVKKFSSTSSCPSVMLARCAMWNPSIFCKSGLRPLDEVIKKFLQYSIKYDNHLANVKYCLQQMMHNNLECPEGRRVLDANSVREICEIFKLEEIYDKVTNELEEKKRLMENVSIPYTVESDADGRNIYLMPFKYNRRDFDKHSSPKMVLYEWSIKHKFDPPTYENIENPEERIYRTLVTFQGIKFTSSLWDKSKKFSEQASACVCILILNYKQLCDSIFPKDVMPPKAPYSERFSSNESSKITLPGQVVLEHNKILKDSINAPNNLPSGSSYDSGPMSKKFKVDVDFKV